MTGMPAFNGSVRLDHSAIVTGTTDPTGLLSITFPQSFPTGSAPVVVAALISVAGWVPFAGAPTATGFVVQAVGVGGSPIVSTSISVSYMASLPH